MKMPAGETKTAPAIGAFANPGDGLRLAAFHRLPHRRIPFVRAVAPAHRARGGDRAQQRRDSLHALAEANVEIPFVANLERLHAGRDWVLGQFFELRVPRRVDRPIDLEGAADPIE